LDEENDEDELIEQQEKENDAEHLHQIEDEV